MQGDRLNRQRAHSLTDLKKRLREYPGRGLFAFLEPVSESICFGYFVTGRSQASRQRSAIWDGSLLSVASDSPGTKHDPLRHYAAAIAHPESFMIGNGAQVAEMSRELGAGSTFATSGANLRFEPDSPIFTPRITLSINSKLALEFISHRACRHRTDVWPERRYYLVNRATAGQLYLMTTYHGSVDRPLGSGSLESYSVDSTDGADVASQLWDSLAPQRRVLMAVFAFRQGRVKLVGHFGSVIDKTRP